MRYLLTTLIASTFMMSAASAATIYPINQATILANSPFDFKVEFDNKITAGDISISINNQNYDSIFGQKGQFVEVEKNKDGKDLGSALILRNVKMTIPGDYKIVVKAGNEEKTVHWQVYSSSALPKAKNVIFLLGDGLSVAHRTAARIMSKGMSDGKANGRLNMDNLDNTAFIGASSVGSISTDSANTMSAYMTGHKTSVNAMGVYADRTSDSFDDPRVENIAEALRRTGKKSLGIVTTAEVEDATPAAIVSHTRRRSNKAEIVDMLLTANPEVLLGGGSAYFLPQTTKGSKRKDNLDYIEKFKNAHYQFVTTKTELEAAKNSDGSLLGLFHPKNIDTALDRMQLKKGTVSKFPDQPSLVDMTKVALERLSKNQDGFFLMVEGASIDKMSHNMDWERAIFETIEFDHAIGVAMEFAKTHPDTLIIVTADHTHGVSLIGTMNDDLPGDEMREKVATYEQSGIPNYVDSNGDGFPDSVDVSNRLAIFSSNYPDYYETFRPKLDGPFEPSVKNDKGDYVANDAYKNVKGAVLRVGNLPKTQDAAVHAVDDVVLQATGPLSQNFRGYMEESDVYKVLADALGFGSTGQ